MTHLESSPLGKWALRASRCGFLGAVVLIASSPAAAGDYTLALAAGADRGRVDCVAAFACDHSSTHFKLALAYQIDAAIDVQAAYFDGGRFQGGDTTPLGTAFGGTFKASGIALTLGYRWQIAPAWSLVARAGLASVRTRFDYANAVWGSASQTTAQPAAGLGLAYALTPALRLGLDLDLTRIKVHTTRGSLRMVGLATQYSF